jgi:hypothetical protein
MIAKVPREKNGKLLAWKFLAKRTERGVVELAYSVPIGKSKLDLERQIDALYAACGAPVEIKDYAGAVVVRVFKEDFPEVIPFEKEMLDLEKDKKNIIVGYSRETAPITHSLRVPHLMIAGKSGYGKTDIVRWFLLQLIHKNTPEEIEIWIVDLKGFSFMPFKRVPHITRIARDLPGAKTLLEDAVQIMEDRSKEVWDSEDREQAARYKTLFVLIDEAYMISPGVTKNPARKKLASACDEAAAKISGTGREAGVGLLYCTQRPDADVINPLVKANMDARICFKTQTESNSIIVLDEPGAEKLPHGKPGRVLFAAGDRQELQVPYIGNDDEWTEVLKPYWRVNHEQERKDIDVGEGDTPIHDGASGEVFFGEWQPVQESERGTQDTGAGKVDRGQAPGDRQGESVAPLLDWSQAFGDNTRPGSF